MRIVEETVGDYLRPKDPEEIMGTILGEFSENDDLLCAIEVTEINEEYIGGTILYVNWTLDGEDELESSVFHDGYSDVGDGSYFQIEDIGFGDLKIKRIDKEDITSERERLNIDIKKLNKCIGDLNKLEKKV